MSLIVQKYGGTSVRDLQHIEAVAEKIIAAKNSGHAVVVVISAMAGETDKLHSLATTITDQPDPAALDLLLAAGEQISTSLLTIALNSRGYKAIALLGSQVKITTDSVHNRARILNIDTNSIKQELAVGKICVIAGFQGVDAAGNITTLGRGGSDLTAVAIAAAIDASECQIYTDVSGVYTADPRIVPNAKQLDRINLNDMIESSGLGTKVLQQHAAAIAGKHDVTIRVLSSTEEGPGTLINNEQNEYCFDVPTVSGVAFSRGEAKIALSGIKQTAKAIGNIVAAISDANIGIDMMMFNTDSKNLSADLIFAVKRDDLSQAMAILQELNICDPKKIVASSGVSKVSLVGSGMRSNANVVNGVCSTLADIGVEIQLLAASEMRLSVLIAEAQLEISVQALHREFDLAVEPKDEIAA